MPSVIYNNNASCIPLVTVWVVSIARAPPDVRFRVEIHHNAQLRFIRRAGRKIHICSMVLPNTLTEELQKSVPQTLQNDKERRKKMKEDNLNFMIISNMYYACIMHLVNKRINNKN